MPESPFQGAPHQSADPQAAPILTPSHPQVRVVIPRRTSLSGERGVLITAATSFKQKNNIYIFLQVGRCAGPVLWSCCAVAMLQSCCAVRCACRSTVQSAQLSQLLSSLPSPPKQSEYGDLYRVSLDYEGEQVKGERRC